jgi:hypothetical protein
MRRFVAIAILVASTTMLPVSEASAQCWYNGTAWNCPPGPDLGPLGPLALPFIAVGAVLTGVLTVVTLPFQAIFGAPYYPPPYYPYYPYYAPPAYYRPPAGSNYAPSPPGSYAPAPGSYAAPPGSYAAPPSSPSGQQAH